jgi:PKD repeat protein
LSNPSINPNISSSYILGATNQATGCSNSDTVFVTVNPSPAPGFRYLEETNPHFSVIFTADDTTLKSYLWNFGDGSTSNDAKRTNYIYKTEGLYIAKLAVTNSFGCSDSSIMNIDVAKSGISKVSMHEGDVNIYPNPFQNNLLIDYNLTKTTNVKIVLCDINGKEVANVITGNQLQGKYQVSINTEKYQLLPGIYLLKLFMGDDYKAIHVVKF